MVNNDNYQLNLTTSRRLTASVYELDFEKPEGFQYLAGQFVEFFIPVNSEMLRRSYSISSAPSSGKLQFCIKSRKDGIGSEYLTSLKVGDGVTVSVAKGKFVCAGEGGKNIFIATGVGIAPVISMLEESAIQNKEHENKLLFGVREESELFWMERLQTLKANDQRFDYQITLSRPGDGWKGQKGRVSEQLIIEKDAEYYLCGSKEMVIEVRGKLIDAGLNTKCIHFEIF